MHESRILGIDLRSQQFGFAVLEGPRTLLDFGRKTFPACDRRDHTVILRKKIVALLMLFTPSVIVVKYVSGQRDRSSLKGKQALEIIKSEVDLRSMTLVCFTRRDIRLAFRQSSNANKHKIATLTAEILPELAWKLPPNRKNWQPEHHNMTIFDAASLGLVYIARFEDVLLKTRQPEGPTIH